MDAYFIVPLNGTSEGWNTHTRAYAEEERERERETFTETYIPNEKTNLGVA